MLTILNSSGRFPICDASVAVIAATWSSWFDGLEAALAGGAGGAL